MDLVPDRFIMESIVPFQRPLLRPSQSIDDLLPATVRNDDAGSGFIQLKAPVEADIPQILYKELDIGRLKVVSNWFWLMGRPTPTKPLHWQHCVGRQVVPMENMGMHLVWTTGKIWIKPIPRFLLDHNLWNDHLRCQSDRRGCSRQSKSETPTGKEPACCLRATALGFLLSYSTLISYESDFKIARDLQLIPEELTWNTWRTFVREFLSQDDIFNKVERRFRYGELRLARLNIAWRFTHFPFATTYMPSYDQYTTFLQAWFATIATVTIYIVVVLTGMQVGLATERLGSNHAFQTVSYGFSVFSILGPLIAVGLLLVYFLIVLFWNWFKTVAYGKKRKYAIEGPSKAIGDGDM